MHYSVWRGIVHLSFELWINLTVHYGCILRLRFMWIQRPIGTLERLRELVYRVKRLQSITKLN